MDEAIKKSENSAEIAYHISRNPDLQGRLLNSSPIDVAMEIHKLDLKFTQGLSQKKVSSAPEPITRVGGSEIGVTGKETAQQYIERRNREELKSRREYQM